MVLIGVLGQRVALAISNKYMKSILTFVMIITMILIFPSFVLGSEKIIINNISLDDFTKSPLMENEVGDLTLLESDKYKFYFYPSENYFILGLFEPQFFSSAFAEISAFLSLDFKDVCKLPIKVPSFESEKMIALCSSSLIIDYDKNGKLTNNDLIAWINQYKNTTKADINNFFDVNFDTSVNALDYSLVYEMIISKIPLDNN